MKLLVGPQRSIPSWSDRSLASLCMPSDNVNTCPKGQFIFLPKLPFYPPALSHPYVHSFVCLSEQQHNMFLRDKPHLLSEIRRATHYGTTPDKQEVDDLRSEVGSLRLQVTEMDSRIEALSRMVDQLLSERSATSSSLSDGHKSEIMTSKYEIPLGSGNMKRRRVDGEIHRAVSADGEPTPIKIETGMECSRTESGIGCGDVSVLEDKEEESDGSMNRFGSKDEGSEGMIIGGEPLYRDTSFFRELDNMSMGSVQMADGGGSLDPLQLFDVTTGVDVDNDGDLFDLDFSPDITSIPGSGSTLSESSKQQTPFLDQPLEQQPTGFLKDSSKAPSAPVDGAFPRYQQGRFEELTASLNAMPTESKRNLAEGLLAMAQSSSMGVALTGTGSSTASPISTNPVPASDGARGAITEPPEIAIPLASAALGAFALHYAKAQAGQEPANAVTAVALDASRHAVKRTTSLR